MKKLVFFVMSIVLIVLLCSCATLHNEPRFTLSESVICLTEPEAYGRYEINESKRCLRNFPIWFYIELNNITVEQTTNGYQHFTNRCFTVIDSNGIEVLVWLIFEYRRVIESERNETPNRIYTWFYFLPIHPQLDLKNGTYTAKFWIKDIYSGQSDEVSIEFTLIEGSDI